VRAAQVVTLDGPDGVSVQDIDPPSAGDGHVLVQIHAVGLSFADLLMSQGRYQLQPELPFVLGIDFAGVVQHDVGELGLATGDRVAGWLSHGSAAEVVAVEIERVFPLPAVLSFEEGAAMPLNYLTAHFALTTRAGAHAGDTVLITGAAGGVGSAAVQVARGLGCGVIGMVSSDAKAAAALANGVDDVMVGPSSQRVRELTDGRGVDVVLDVVGSDEVVLESLRSLSASGRLLSLGYVAGSIPSVRLNRLLLNNIDVRGVSFGSYARQHPGFARRQWDKIELLVAAGRVRPLLGSVGRLEDIADELRAIQERRAIGKTVLTVR
jgi:NADPH:quinone reductase